MSWNSHTENLVSEVQQTSNMNMESTMCGIFYSQHINIHIETLK